MNLSTGVFSLGEADLPLNYKLYRIIISFRGKIFIDSVSIIYSVFRVFILADKFNILAPSE